MVKPYGERGPHRYDDQGTSYEQHWTLGDLLNGLSAAGFRLEHVGESAAQNAQFWQTFSYESSSAGELLDWQHNPRTGLPAWLTVTARKLEMGLNP